MGLRHNKPRRILGEREKSSQCKSRAKGEAKVFTNLFFSCSQTFRVIY